ncbi:MAG: hypothetical protein WCT18_01410 [Patescibacteria group bacterium]
MPNNWAKIVDLIRQTGDRVIVLDGQEAFSVSLINESTGSASTAVEKIASEKVLEKINQEIALWQRREKEQEMEEELKDDLSKLSQEQVEDSYYLEPVL